MDRFLCQLCYSIVLYGEKHPCFCYKTDNGDDDDYIESLLEESEEKGKKHDVILEESHKRNLTDDSGKIPGNKVESSKVISPTAKTNERTFSPALKKRSQDPSLIAGTSDAISPKMFHDSSLYDSTVRIQECEGNLNENNAISEVTWIPNALPNTVSSPLKKELEEFNFSGNNHFSTPVAVGLLSYKWNGQQSQEIMKDAALVEGPSGIRPQSRTSAVKLKHVCTLCPLQFQNKINLVCHYRTHTGEKPFKCESCGKKFTQKGNLEAHLLTHTGEKPHTCDICGKGFNRKHHLAYHYGTHTR